MSIKIQENNFLLWNQKVDGVILSHKLHKVVVNSEISPMLKIENDRVANMISENFEA